jgi:hypothetical protein
MVYLVMASSRPDKGVQKNDGRNMTKPVRDKDNAQAKSHNPGSWDGVHRTGKNVQNPPKVLAGNPNAGQHQFRGDGPAPATTAHGKTPSPARPDNGNARGALPSAGWKGSGAPNTGRAVASPGMKHGKGRENAISGPTNKEYAPA